MYDTLIIDLDGPLFNGREAMLKAMNATVEQFAELHGRPSRNLKSLPLLAPTELIHLVYAETDLPPNDLSHVREYYRDVLKRTEDLIDIEQPVRKWLATMVQYRWSLAILTSRREEEAVSLLTAKGVAAQFKVVVGRDSGPMQKPSGAGITSILEKLSKSSVSAVMVGDSDSDFAAAKAAGVAYIHAGWSTEPSTVQLLNPSLVVGRPQDVCDALQASPLTLSPAGLPDLLVKAIELGDLALFAGAGVSIPSGLGGWKEHYQPLLEQTGVNWMTGTRDLPDVLQLACTTDEGSLKVFDEFKNSFGGRPRPNYYHFAMLRTLARRIWTSNYDQLFERAIDIGGLDQRVVKDDKELLNNYAAGRLVIKVNGDFEDATFDKNLRWGVVLTRQQFDRALTERPEVWRLFEDDFRNRSLVFVGVSFQDPILRQVVAIATDRIPRTHHTHYLLAKVPDNPMERTLQTREAQNLEKFHIRTLWFQTHADIRHFVAKVAVVARRPIVGVAGSTQTQGLGSDSDSVVLLNGQLKAAQLRELNVVLGQVLARQGYRVTSGGAPYVGMEAVEAAFVIRPSCARFYFRHGGGRNYRRLAPAIIVEGAGYGDMRRRFIGELSLLIAMGGHRVDGDDGGVEEEIKLATEFGVPVLLFPQAGGDVARLRGSFMDNLGTRYSGEVLSSAIRQANETCATVAPEELQNFVRRDFACIVENVLEALVESTIDAKASKNDFSSEYSW
jgi:phosphoglycolate phosphatase-like HAD superfamily hydrolase